MVPLMLLFHPIRLRLMIALLLLLVAGQARSKADIIGEWNDYALTAARDGGLLTPQMSRNMAMLHTSIYNAVEGIAGNYNLYTHGGYTGPSGSAVSGASMQAAAAAAAYTVMADLYPGMLGDFASLYSSQLSSLADDQAKLDGINFGSLVANDILGWRVSDGASDASNPLLYTPLGSAGHWAPTGPTYADAALPGWGSVSTFAAADVNTYTGSLGMTNATYLTTPGYTADYNTVKDIGSATSGTRTTEQTDAALFWEGAPGTITNIGLWNKVAAGIVSGQSLGLADSARLYAALNVALADAAIVAWDTKFEVDLWSPETAIQNGASDGNGDTAGNPAWQPLLTSPNSPSYFAEQAIFGGAASGILESYAGTNYAFTLDSDTDGDGINDITLNFSSLAAARDMAMLSGLWGGSYFEKSVIDSAATGDQLASLVLGSQFAAVPEPGGLALLALSLAGLLRRRR